MYRMRHRAGCWCHAPVPLEMPGRWICAACGEYLDRLSHERWVAIRYAKGPKFKPRPPARARKQRRPRAV